MKRSIFLFFVISSLYLFRCGVTPNRGEEYLPNGEGDRVVPSDSGPERYRGDESDQFSSDFDGAVFDGTTDIEDKVIDKPLEREKAPPKFPKDGWTATIVHVTDGDTLHLTMYPGGWASRVRLRGVNAPECQKGGNGGFQSCTADEEFFGLEAYRILEGLIKQYGRKVIIHCDSGSDGFCRKDPFRRYLVYLEFKAGGGDLGKALLLKGAVWTFTRYPTNRLAEYCAAEAEAIKNRRGMWKYGRSYVRQRMGKGTKSWYYSRSRTKNHDAICSKALGKSFSKLAGE